MIIMYMHFDSVSHVSIVDGGKESREDSGCEEERERERRVGE